MQIDFSSLTEPISLKETRANFSSSLPWAQANFWIGLVMLVTFVLITVLSVVSMSSGTLFYLAMFVYLGTGVRLMLDAVRQASASLRLRRFAAVNSHVFTSERHAKNKSAGTIFSPGVTRVIAAFKTAGEDFIEIGNLQFVSGSGGMGNTLVYGFVRLKLPRQLPHLFLKSKHSRMPLPAAFESAQKLSLEGNFDDYFTLYVPREYERDALYVLPPDIMYLFMEKAQDFTIEMVDNELILYYKTHFKLTEPATWTLCLGLVQQIAAKFNHQIRYYMDEKAGAGSAHGIAALGRRLRTRWSVAEILLYAFMVTSAGLLLYLVLSR